MANEPLKVEITGDVKGLTDALERGTSGIKGFAKDTEAVTKGLGNVISNLKAPFLALAAVFGGGAFLKGTVTETKEWTVEAQKLSRTLGITTEQASILNVAIGDIYGTSEEYLGAVAKLTKTLNTNEEAFRKLGVATRDQNGHLRSTPSIMADVNTALVNMKSGTDRNIETTRIYGRGWVDIQRYLGLTQEVMEAAREKAEKLNLLVGQDSVSATKAYRASMNDLDDTVKGLKIRIGSELMPVLTTLNNDLAESGPSAVGALGSAFTWIYGIILGLREEIEAFGVNLSYLWKTVTLQVATAGAQARAIMRGDFAEAKAIGDAAAAWEITRAKATAAELAAIQEKYTGKQMTLLGLDRKKPAPVTGAGGGAGASTGTDAGKSPIDNEALSYNEMIQWMEKYLQKRQEVHDKDAAAAAKRAADMAQERAEYFNLLSERQAQESQIVTMAQRVKGAMLEARDVIVAAFGQIGGKVLTGQMTVLQGITAIYKAISRIVIQSLGEVLAAQIKAAIMERILHKGKQQDNMATTGTNVVAASSEFFKAHAWIPWVGAAIAIGMIALMANQMKQTKAQNGVVGAAEGGWFDRPTLTMIGEGSQRELVVPENSFKNWAGNLAANIAANERQISAYQLQGAGYASAAAAAGGIPQPIDLRGAIIAGESSESARIISNLIRQHGQGWDRRNG